MIRIPAYNPRMSNHAYYKIIKDSRPDGSDVYTSEGDVKEVSRSTLSMKYAQSLALTYKGDEHWEDSLDSIVECVNDIHGDIFPMIFRMRYRFVHPINSTEIIADTQFSKTVNNLAEMKNAMKVFREKVKARLQTNNHSTTVWNMQLYVFMISEKFDDVEESDLLTQHYIIKS